MSVNIYKAETNELELLAGASEIPRWSGTQAKFNVLDKSTLAEGTIIEITDDLSTLPTIDDTTASASTTWSSQKINDSLVDIEDKVGIKKKTITASISINGNLNANLSETQIAIMAVRTDADTPVVIVRDKDNNTNVHCYKDWSLTSCLTSETVTCDVYYLEMQ